MDLEKLILQKLLLKKETLATAIKDKITNGLDEAINFDDPNSDHVKPTPADDSFLPPVQIMPLHHFTKLRRRAFFILYGKSAKIFQAQQEMKDDALGSTVVTVSDGGDRIKVRIENTSRLVQFLSKGGNPSMLSSSSDAINREFFAILTPTLKGYVDWASVPQDVKAYLGILASVKKLSEKERAQLVSFGYDYQHEGFSISAITPRRILHASAETMGKGFIKDNLV